MRTGISVFLASVAVALLFLGLERLVGINHGFHPDSLYYIDNYHLYERTGWGALLNLNNFYYQVVSALRGNVALIIGLNIVVFALTNVVIAGLFGTRSSRVSVLMLLVMFLPYRLHLACHVLKDTFIILFTVSAYFCSFRLMPLMGYFLAAFRVVASALTLGLRFLPRRPIYVILASVVILGAALFSREVAGVVLERGEADMGGRDFLSMPLQGATNVLLILLRSLLWPLSFKTGIYPLLTGSAAVLAIALEQILTALIAIRARNIWFYLLAPGTLAMIVISLLVNSFGAYLRYIYPFFVIDMLLLCLLANGTPFVQQPLPIRLPRFVFRRN